MKRIQSYISKSDDEKIAIAKSQIRQSILKMISDAEVDYEAWTKAGSIKRSQVIQKIFADYPILSKILDQDEITKWIDEMIDESLKTLRAIIAENNATNNNADKSIE